MINLKPCPENIGLYELSEFINNNMFKLLAANRANLGVYAFKGGYVLSHFKNMNARRTMDIDMSVELGVDFKYIVELLTPLFEELKSKGYIFSYEIHDPVISEELNRSGGVDFYELVTTGEPRKFGGLDISLHDLSYGIITLSNGICVFSDERSIADKLNVLFNGDARKIRRRVRDVYDLYLYSESDISLDPALMRRCLGKREVNIQAISYFENMTESPKQLNGLYDILGKLLSSGKRVDPEYAKFKGITPEKIIQGALFVIDLLRRGL